MKTLAQNKRVKYRSATREDITDFFGSVPHRMKATVFFYDDEIAAMAGYYTSEGKVVVFSDIIQGIDVPDMTIWRCIKIVMDEIGDKKKNSYAFAEQKHVLEKFGYKKFCQVGDQEVYQWGN